MARQVRQCISDRPLPTVEAPGGCRCSERNCVGVCIALGMSSILAGQSFNHQSKQKEEDEYRR